MAVQQDHRDALEVCAMQDLIAADVELLELELELGLEAFEDLDRVVAQMTIRMRVHGHHAHSGRSPVA
jgi:hypothetical protein